MNIMLIQIKSGPYYYVSDKTFFECKILAQESVNFFAELIQATWTQIELCQPTY